MDLRAADQTTIQQELIERAMTRLNTCIPGIVQSFDSSTQRATVIPGVKTKIFRDNQLFYQDLPPVVNVPVVFPFAGGFGCTLPVTAGDPCLILFAQKCIDNWLLNGGIQPPEQDIPGARHHDLTDAIVILGLAPNPNVLGSWNSSGIELRNSDRTVRCTIQNDKAEMAFGSTLITLDSNGGKLTGTWKLNDIVLNTHTHNDPQGGVTGGPQ